MFVCIELILAYKAKNEKKNKILKKIYNNKRL